MGKKQTGEVIGAERKWKGSFGREERSVEGKGKGESDMLAGGKYRSGDKVRGPKDCGRRRKGGISVLLL